MVHEDFQCYVYVMSFFKVILNQSLTKLDFTGPLL